MRAREVGKGESHSHPFHVDILVGTYMFCLNVGLPMHEHLGRE